MAGHLIWTKDFSDVGIVDPVQEAEARFDYAKGRTALAGGISASLLVGLPVAIAALSTVRALENTNYIKPLVYVTSAIVAGVTVNAVNHMSNQAGLKYALETYELAKEHNNALSRQSGEMLPNTLTGEAEHKGKIDTTIAKEMDAYPARP
jgi:hypothetical protein